MMDTIYKLSQRFAFSLVLTITVAASAAAAPHGGESAPGKQYVMAVSADGKSTECVGMDEATFEQFFGISLHAARADFESQDAVFSNVVTSTFDVTYTGFTAQAQAAFQHAVDILSSVFSSPVPIKVDARFQSLGQGILGSAGPNGSIRDGTGLPLAGTWFPMPLGESLIGSDTGFTSSDIIATLNSGFADWYLGTDGTPPGGKWDMVTVALHELLHGLGFVDSFNVSGGQGSWGDDGFPFVYDLSVRNAAGQMLVSDFANPSAALAAQLQSNHLYFGGFTFPRRIFAPSPFQPGSSIAHVDPTTFPQGNVDALMRPGISSGFAIHSLGPVTASIFSDMGWTITAPAEMTGCIFNCDVGMGTGAPQAALHLQRSDGSAKVLVRETNATPTPRTLFALENNGAVRFNFVNNTTGDDWFFSQDGLGRFIISLVGTGGPEMLLGKDGRVLIGPGTSSVFDLSPTGNLNISGTLQQNSNREAKANFMLVDPKEILGKVARLPISSWNFRFDDESVRHLGPMAQDFHATFGLGGDETKLAPLDVSSVALAAIQGLLEELASEREKNQRLQNRVSGLERRLAALEAALIGAAD